MMMWMHLFLLSLLATITQADKDTRYYPPGRTNPNVDQPYYFKNSLNVMQDLDEFSALYVKYEGCVWSRYGFGDGCTDVGQANQDDDEEANEAYWYLGRTMCFRSNVAYVLYGTLKGDKDMGCHKKRYIKSFFTEWGPESFASPLGVDASQASSQCQNKQQRQRELLLRQLEDRNDERWNFADDDEWKKQYEYPFYDTSEHVSYSTGCSADGKFVTQQFNGGVCDGKQEQVIVDYLEDFNDDMENLGCKLIYNVSEEVSYNDGNNNEEDCRQDEDGGMCFDSPLGIIMNSQACLLDQYPKVCPDPYGTLARYTRNLNMATGMAPVNLSNMRMKKGVATCLTCIGAMMLVLAAFVRTKRKENPNARSKRGLSEGDGVMVDRPLADDASDSSGTAGPFENEPSYRSSAPAGTAERAWEDLDKSDTPAHPLMRIASDVSSTVSSVFKAATEIEPEPNLEFFEDDSKEVPYQPPSFFGRTTQSAEQQKAAARAAQRVSGAPNRGSADTSDSEQEKKSKGFFMGAFASRKNRNGPKYEF